MPKRVIDYMDVQTMAAKMCEEEEDDERDVIEAGFENKFGLDLDSFEKLLEALLPMITISISPITEKAFIGFADQKAAEWLIRKEVPNEFMSAVVQWLGGNEIKESGKGMQRDVIINGKKEFEITIVKE